MPPKKAQKPIEPEPTRKNINKSSKSDKKNAEMRDSHDGNDNNNNNDGDEEDPQVTIEKYQTILIKSFTAMVEDSSTLPQQLRRLARLYFNCSEETDHQVSIQLMEAVFRLSAQLFLIDEKSETFQTYFSLMPRIWRTLSADMFTHCKIVEGWSEDQFKERITTLQEQATSAVFRFLSREINVGTKQVKLLAMRLLEQYVHDLSDKFELSEKDGVSITTALMPRLLDKSLEIKKRALSACAPFLFSSPMYNTIRYLAVSDPNEEIRRTAIALLYRPSFVNEYKTNPQLQAIDALIFVARMQDESPQIRSTLLQLFEEKELRIIPIAEHGFAPQRPGSNIDNNDIRIVNNNNVYSMYGTLFTCEYNNNNPSSSKTSSSKLNYRQKLWVIKQGLTDPDRHIVWQTMNILTKLFCCQNFSLIDFILYLSCGQHDNIVTSKSDLTPEQLSGLRMLKDTLLLSDNAAYHHNNKNNNKIWTSTIAQLTTSLNRSSAESGSNSFVDPQVFTMGSSGSGTGGVTGTNDPLSLFMSSSSGSVLNSSIYQDLCIVISYIVCSYTWRHTIERGDETIDYEYYKRKRIAPQFGPKSVLNLGNTNSSSSSTRGSGLTPSIEDDNDIKHDADDELLDQLMNQGKNVIKGTTGGGIDGQDPESDKKKSTKAATTAAATKKKKVGKKGGDEDGDAEPDDENDEKKTVMNPALAATTATTTTTTTTSNKTGNDPLLALPSSININNIKLNTRQVVLEIPDFSKMLRQTAFHFQYSMFTTGIAEHEALIAEYQNIMVLKEQGDQEALALDVAEPIPPVEPQYHEMFPDDPLPFDPNTSVLTSGLCLLWYLLLSSLSGQTNATFLDALKSYQAQYQQQEVTKVQLSQQQSQQQGSSSSQRALARIRSLPLIDFQQIQTTQPRLSCPGFNSPELAVSLMNTRYLEDLQPDLSTTLGLIPLLDQFSQPSLSLHVLLLTYHIDVKRTNYLDLSTFYHQYQNFISSPEFQNAFLPLVFLNIRALQPIVILRFYQHRDNIQNLQFEYRQQYQQQQIQLLKTQAQADAQQTGSAIDQTNLQRKIDQVQIDAAQIDFETMPELTTPVQPPTYVSLMADLSQQFFETIISIETAAAKAHHPFKHQLAEALTPLETTQPNNNKNRRHNNRQNRNMMMEDELGTPVDNDDIDDESDDISTDVNSFDQPNEDMYTHNSIRQQYRTQLLILQKNFNELRHHSDQERGLTTTSSLKIIKRATFIKKEYNKFRNYYYTYVGHLEFLLKRLLIIVLDLFTHCPVVPEPKVHSSGDEISDQQLTEKLIDYFNVNICCPENIMHYILNDVVYPILGWRQAVAYDVRDVANENGEIVQEQYLRPVWFDLDFYSVDINLLLINILTQSALLSTNSFHITIVLQFLLIFTTIVTDDTNGITAINHDNQDLFQFKSYNTRQCQTINYAPRMNGLIDIVDGQGFFTTRHEGIAGNPIAFTGHTVGDGNDGIRDKFLDITKMRAYSQMFIHPILQLQSIKGITDILFAFVNLIPITSHQHSYDRLDKGWDMKHQPRQTVLSINSNDEIPSDLLMRHLKNQELPIGIPIDVVMKCHKVLLGYGQTYVDQHNEISTNYQELIQQYPMLEVEQAIGNIYRSISKFYYNHERHSHYAERLRTGKVTRTGGDGKKKLVHTKAKNPNNIDDDDDDDDQDNDGNTDFDAPPAHDIADQFSDCDLEEEIKNLENDTSLTPEQTASTKRAITHFKQTRDYHKQAKIDIREAYATTQGLLFGRLVASLGQIHRLVAISTHVVGDNPAVSLDELSQLPKPPRSQTILTGDLVCISDLSYDLTHSLQHGPAASFESLSIDGMSTPLRDLKTSYNDPEVFTRLNNIFSGLVEQQSFLQPSSSRSSDSGMSSKRNSSTNSPLINTEPVLDLFLHDDIFLLFKSIRPDQVMGDLQNQQGNKKNSGEDIHARVIRKATPYELVPYAHYDNAFLILRGLEDYLVEKDFFHSLASTTQLTGEDNTYREWFENLRAHKHSGYQAEVTERGYHKHHYNTLYHVPMTSEHLNLYTNTYISIIYQSIQNTAIFSLCKLLFFNRVPYVLAQQYLSLLTIATITSRVKNDRSKAMKDNNTNFGLVSSHSVSSASVQQQDLFNVLELFFHCYIKLNYQTTNLITPTNQHYVYTLHLYQNIAKKIAFKKWQNADGVDQSTARRDKVSIDAITFGFALYDFSLVKDKKQPQVMKKENNTNDDAGEHDDEQFNYFDPEDIGVQNIPTLHHIKDNLPLRKYLWGYLSAKDQAMYKQLYHSSHFAADWGLSNGVSVCDHLSLLASSAPTVIYDIITQFSKAQTLALIPLYIDFVTLQLSPHALSHSNSVFNPAVATNSNLPFNFAQIKPNSPENINAQVQHGMYASLSSSVSPLAKFGIDLLSIVTNTHIFDQHFLSSMTLIKVIISAISDWQILPRDFYPLFHQHQSNLKSSKSSSTHPDDIVSENLYPELYLSPKQGGPEGSKTQNTNGILQGSSLLEHTISSPSRRSVIGFYLFLDRAIQVYGLLQRHSIALPAELSRKGPNKGGSKSKQDEDIASQRRLALFYDTLVENIKDLVSKLIYFMSLTRASSHNKPIRAKKPPAAKKKAPAAKKKEKLVKKRPSQIDSDHDDGSDDDSHAAKQEIKNEDDDENDAGEEDQRTDQHSQLINYSDPLIHFLNKRVVTETASSALSSAHLTLFSTPLSYDVFYLHQLINQHQHDRSYAIESLLNTGLTLDSLTTIEHNDDNNHVKNEANKRGLAGGSTLLVDNDIEDFVTALTDQRRQTIAKHGAIVPNAVWKRHFMKIDYIGHLLAENKDDLKRAAKQSMRQTFDDLDGNGSDDSSDDGENGAIRNQGKPRSRYIQPTGKVPRRPTKTPRKKLGATFEESGDESGHSGSDGSDRFGGFDDDGDDDDGDSENDARNGNRRQSTQSQTTLKHSGHRPSQTTAPSSAQSVSKTQSKSTQQSSSLSHRPSRNSKAQTSSEEEEKEEEEESDDDQEETLSSQKQRDAKKAAAAAAAKKPAPSRSTRSSSRR